MASVNDTPMLYDDPRAQEVDIKTTDFNPSEKERKLVKKINKLFSKAKKHRSKYDEKWLDYYKFFRGRQWKEQRPSYRHAEVINLIFREIQSSVPIMTDSRPRFDFLPQEPEDREFAGILNKIAESDWIKYNWLHQLTEVIYDAHIYGAGFSSIYHDKEKEDGLGAICFESSDPFYCFPDPNSTDVNTKGHYFIYAEPMDLDLVKKKWPKGKHVRADMIDFLKGDKTDLDEVRFKSPVDTAVIQIGNESPDKDMHDRALIITCYMDSSWETVTEKVEDVDDNGQPIIRYIKRKKYPQGRKVVISGNVVLEDTDNPYEHGKIPYQRLLNYILPREFWGISDVEQLEGPQKTFNKLISFSLDVLTLMGNPIWVVDDNSGIDTDNLFNQPGLIVEKNAGSEVRRESGVQLQPYVLQLIDRLKIWFDDVSGSTDSSRGVRPEGVTAASAIQALQESSLTRLRQKSRNIDTYLQDVGRQYFNLVLQYYSAPRVYRLTNDDGSQQYFKMNIESIPQDGRPDVKVARMREYGEVNGKLIEGETEEHVIKGDFDVVVNTGSTLPFSKVEKENKAFQLFDRQIIDAEEVLRAIDYPNKEAVLERLKEREQAAQEAAAQQQGQQGPV